MDKEYVGREEVIKILEHYDLSSGSTLGYHSGAIECAISEIEMLPAADVVEVVRCKDCKWYSELVCGEGKLLGSQGWCNEVMARSMPSNGFCSFGERENNG